MISRSKKGRMRWIGRGRRMRKNSGKGGKGGKGEEVKGHRSSYEKKWTSNKVVCTY